MWDEMVAGDPAVQNGYIKVPAGPTPGVEPSEEVAREGEPFLDE
jgi:L-alanine-DL-glutamate epimerase-like enolase superfamily enzyme